MNPTHWKNPYGAITVLIVLTALGLAAFSVQGAFVALLLISLAAALRLLYTARQTAREQLAVSREIASWLATMHRSGAGSLAARGSATGDPTKPQA
jgi:hypothetical protein